MRKARRWRWVVAAVLVLLGMVALYVAILVYPTPLFANHLRTGAFGIHSDRAPSVDIEKLVAELAERLTAFEHGPGSQTYRVYLCHSLRRYNFFTRLTRRSPSSQAIGLSAPGNIFVSMPRLAELAANQGKLFAHSRFEGRPAFAIAHEIAHFRIIDALGLDASRSLPTWKSEGWADYQANLAAIRGDPDYDLGHRIDLLDAPQYWRDPQLRARRFYQWQLLTEYLAEVRGYRFDDLARSSVTESETLDQMRAWRRAASKEALRTAAAIRAVLEADSELGRARNRAPESTPLAEAVRAYVRGLDAIDFTECPTDFTRSFEQHRDAWHASIRFFEEHSEMRGELHDLFDEIRDVSVEARMSLESIERDIGDTWAEVEAAASRHGGGST